MNFTQFVSSKMKFFKMSLLILTSLNSFEGCLLPCQLGDLMEATTGGCLTDERMKPFYWSTLENKLSFPCRHQTPGSPCTSDPYGNLALVEAEGVEHPDYSIGINLMFGQGKRG